MSINHSRWITFSFDPFFFVSSVIKYYKIVMWRLSFSRSRCCRYRRCRRGQIMWNTFAPLCRLFCFPLLGCRALFSSSATHFELSPPPIAPLGLFVCTKCFQERKKIKEARKIRIHTEAEARKPAIWPTKPESMILTTRNLWLATIKNY
jgi:hypothetical protein